MHLRKAAGRQVRGGDAITTRIGAVALPLGIILTNPGAGAGLAPFGLAAAVTTAASFTVLQAVDGIALKRAVDAWASASADQHTAAFAAAEAVRWIEIGMNSLSKFLVGLTLRAISTRLLLTTND